MWRETQKARCATNVLKNGHRHTSPPALYLGVHLVEGKTLTPMLLARRFTLNPVLVILSLLFWFWMWGVPGAILAVPMLAIVKIISDRVRPLKAFGHFLEGEEAEAPKARYHVP
jgi:predicted PurR-regulated permease PerM